jgi:hypothetical protein
VAEAVELGKEYSDAKDARNSGLDEQLLPAEGTVSLYGNLISLPAG